MALSDVLSNIGKANSLIKKLNPTDPVAQIGNAIDISKSASDFIVDNTGDSNAPTGFISDSTSPSANFANSIAKGNITTTTPVPNPNVNTFRSVNPNAKKAPTGVLSDSASPSANFANSIAQGNITTTTPDSQSFIDKNSTATTTTTTPSTTTTTTDTKTTDIATPDAVSGTIKVGSGYTDANGKSLTGKALADAKRKAGDVGLGDSSLLTQSDADIAARKQKEITDLKAKDEATLATDRINSQLAASNNIDTLRTGLADMTRSVQADLNNYKNAQNELTSKFESERKMRVSGEVRARLAAAGKDISKMPFEELIALSDSVGVAAFNDIYNKKQDTLNNISSKQETATNKLNDLRAKGIVGEQEYETLKNNIDATFNKTVNEVKRAYVNDIFGLADKTKTAKEAKETSAVNTIETFLKNIPTTQAASFRARYSNLIKSGLSPADVTKAITNDPQYIQWSEYLAKSQQAAAVAKATAENAKLQSEAIKNIGMGNKYEAQSKGGGGSGSKPRTVSDSVFNASLAEGISGINTREDLVNLAKTNPQALARIQERVTKAITPLPTNQ